MYVILLEIYKETRHLSFPNAASKTINDFGTVIKIFNKRKTFHNMRKPVITSLEHLYFIGSYAHLLPFK